MVRTIMYLQISFCVIVSLIACDNPQGRRDSFHKKAITHYQQGEYDDALVETKNVLRIDARFAPAYVLLGDIALKKNLIKNAYKNFIKGYELDPGSKGANIGLVTCYLRGGEYQRARKHIQHLLDVSPHDPKVQYLHALILCKEGHFQESVDLALKLIVSEKSRDIFLLLADNYMGLKKRNLAAQTLRDGIKALGDDIPIHLALARVYEFDKQIERAEEEYVYLASLDSADESYSYLLADFYIQHNKTDQLKKVLLKLINAKNNDPAIKLLAGVLTREGKVEEARRLLTEHVGRAPSNFALKRVLVEFYISQKEFPAAIQALGQLLAADHRITEQNEYRKMLASIYRFQKKTREVREQMQLVLASDPDDADALMFSAREFVKNGPMNNAVLQFRQVIHLESDKDRAYLALANAYLLSGDSSMAVQVLFECIENNGSPRARFTLARIFEEKKRYDRAIEQWEILKEQHSKDIKFLNHLALLYVKEHKLIEAEKCLKNCVLLDSDPSASHIVLADFYRMTGKFKHAHGEVDTVLQASPDNMAACEEKIKIFHTENKDGLAFEFISKKIHDPWFREYLKGELYAMNQKYDKAESHFLKSLQNKHNTKKVYYGLVNVYLAQKKYSRGIEICKKITSQHPDDAKGYFLMGYMYQLDTKYTQAVTAYKIVLEKSPTFFPAVNNLAFLYAERFPSKENLDDALELMLGQSYAMNTEALDTLAWIYTKQGNLQRSIGILEKLYAHSDSSPVIAYHLGVSYMKNGDLVSARSCLEKSIASDKDFLEKAAATELLKSLQG